MTQSRFRRIVREEMAKSSRPLSDEVVDTIVRKLGGGWSTSQHAERTE